MIIGEVLLTTRRIVIANSSYSEREREKSVNKVAKRANLMITSSFSLYSTLLDIDVCLN